MSNRVYFAQVRDVLVSNGYSDEEAGKFIATIYNAEIRFCDTEMDFSWPPAEKVDPDAFETISETGPVRKREPITMPKWFKRALLGSVEILSIMALMAVGGVVLGASIFAVISAWVLIGWVAGVLVAIAALAILAFVIALSDNILEKAFDWTRRKGQDAVL